MASAVAWVPLGEVVNSATCITRLVSMVLMKACITLSILPPDSSQPRNMSGTASGIYAGGSGSLGCVASRAIASATASAQPLGLV